MLKSKIILLLVKIVMWLIAVGLGIWYLSSSLGGSAITYTSMNNFFNAIGVQGGDISTANGCFLCSYVSELFSVLSNATERFWGLLLENLWMLIVVGFGIFLFDYTAQFLFDAMKGTESLDAGDKKLKFSAWFDKVWRQGLRVMIVGVLIGALGMGGSTALKTISNITITPVMYLGAELSMAASGVTSAAQCAAVEDASDTVLGPVLKPFMCVIGNINTVVLAGAAGGFSMMNYAWMGFGGGTLTWLTGLLLVFMFMYIGFDLFFQILSVVFKLIFVIIFMPIFLAASAFEGTWSMASGLLDKAIKMLVSSAVKIIGITLKVILIYATVSYCADLYFPGPRDGYTIMLPPLLGTTVENPDNQTLSVINVFSECERVGLANGEMDGDKFKECFVEKRAAVESVYPGAFDFMDDAWDFLLMMAGLFILYYYAISPKIDNLLGKDGTELFDFGGMLKSFGKTAYKLPEKLTGFGLKAFGKK